MLMIPVRWLVVASLFACAHHEPPLAPAGTERDEGHGELARASRRLLTAEEGSEPDPFAEDRPGARRDGAYGGSTYAGYSPPSWPVLSIDRDPDYDQLDDAAGVVEGTVTWRGPVPPTPTSRCGALPPPVRVAARSGGARRGDTRPAGAATAPTTGGAGAGATGGAGAGAGVGGVLVIVDRVERGRVLPMDSRPSTVGGAVAKQGCAFLPTAQIVTPLPAPLVVHGDATAVRVRIGAKDPVDLQAGGRVAVPAPAGVTRVDDADATHAAAWIVATTSPAYAITDDVGRYRLDELAPGRYDITFWHPPLPTVANGAITYGAPLVVKRSVRVGPRPARLDVVLAR